MTPGDGAPAADQEGPIGTVFAATVPFFLLLGVGMVAGYTSRFATAEPAINAFVFWVALPAFLFESIARTDPSSGCRRRCRSSRSG